MVVCTFPSPGIANENEFTSDSIQTLSYYLCYTYARCTQAVSIVPPVYYAHLACSRARLHIQKCSSSEESSNERSEEHTSELQSRSDLVCRLLLEKKKKTPAITTTSVCKY